MQLKDILERLRGVDTRIELFAPSAKFEAVYDTRLDRLAEAICKELRIKDIDDAMSLPGDTELKSREVLRNFEALCEWLDSRHQPV